eukprot:NODE_41_length_34096_cov_2.002235.p21 type:complete len:204 gc:universal NODE_41_length_34096_cov_2.002235:178-789(+)
MIQFDLFFIFELIIHLFILLTLIIYLKFRWPLPELQLQLIVYYFIAILMHLLLIMLPNNSNVVSFSHFPRFYQLYCFGHVAHRFALFNLRYLVNYNEFIEAVLISFIILPGNFSVVTFDIVHIDISGGWFMLNMSINTITYVFLDDRSKYFVFLNYVISLTFVVLYYTSFPKFYCFWYLTYLIFIILRVESLQKERGIVPVET